MAEINAGLCKLHLLHRSLQGVREQLSRGPKQVEARRQLALKAGERCKILANDLKQAKADADRKALDLRSNEAKIDGLRQKLNAASSNREYDIIRGQIDADMVANSVLEDEILEALEKVDRLQVELVQAQEQQRQTELATATCQQSVSAAEGGLREQAVQLEQQIRESESLLTGEPRTKYRRLVEAHGADSLAAVDGKVCTHCYVALTPQSLVHLNSNDVVFCKSCGRLLYLSGTA